MIGPQRHVWWPMCDYILVRFDHFRPGCSFLCFFRSVFFVGSIVRVLVRMRTSLDRMFRLALLAASCDGGKTELAFGSVRVAVVPVQGFRRLDLVLVPSRTHRFSTFVCLQCRSEDLAPCRTSQRRVRVLILRHGGSNLWVRVRRTCVFLFVPLPFSSIASDVSIHVSSFFLLPRSFPHRSHTRIVDVVQRTCPPPLVAAVPTVPSWTCFASSPFQWACFETGPSARSLHLFPRLDPTPRDAPRTWRWRTTSSSSSSSWRFRSDPEPKPSKKGRKNTIHQGIKN